MTDKELLRQAFDALNGLLGWQSLAPHEDQENAKAVAFQISARLSQCERCGEKNPAEIHTCTPPDVRQAQQRLTDLAQAEGLGLCDKCDPDQCCRL